MKKLLFIAMLSMSGLSYSGDFSPYIATGELIENETSLKEFCSEIKNLDDRCEVKNLDDYMLASVVLSQKDDEVEAVNVIIKKSDFAKNEGKKVKAHIDLPNPIGEVIQVF